MRKEKNLKSKVKYDLVKLHKRIPTQHQKLMKLATFIAVFSSLAMVGMKLIAWKMSSSMALLSSFVDSSLDVLAAGLNIVMIFYALKPVDEEHRFGHGKAEPLGSIFQALFIIATAIYLFIESTNRFLNPQAIEHTSIGIIVMLISLGLTGVVVLFQRYAVRHTKSVAIDAAAVNYMGDLVMGGCIILSLLLTRWGFLWIDAVAGFLIATYLSYNGLRVIYRSFELLMDKEFPQKQRKQIIDIIMKHPEVLAIHDLRTRSSGALSFIQFTLKLNEKMSLKKADTITDEIEEELCKIFPSSDVIIHMEPQKT